MGKKIDELLAKAEYPPQRSGPKCWATKLDDAATEFVKRMEERVAEKGFDAFVWSHVGSILRDDLGVTVVRDDGGIRKHFRGLCRCPR